MGLIVNKSAPDLNFMELLNQLDITADRPSVGVDVHYGSPVEHGRGFVLHTRDYSAGDSTLTIDDEFEIVYRKNKSPVGYAQAHTDPGILPLSCL